MAWSVNTSGKSDVRSGSRESGSRESNSEVLRSQRPPDLNLIPADEEVISPLKCPRADPPPTKRNLRWHGICSLRMDKLLWRLLGKRKNVKSGTITEKGAGWLLRSSCLSIIAQH